MTLLTLALTAYAEPPLQLPHQGRLLDDVSGMPLQGAQTVDFSLFDLPSGGTQLWSESQSVDFTDGYYFTTFGAGLGNPLPISLFDEDSLFLDVSVGGVSVGDRIPVLSVPFAIRARTATNVEGGVVNASEIQIDGTTVIDSSGTFQGEVSGTKLSDLTCTSDQIPLYDGLQWACVPAPTGQGNPSWNDLTDVPTDLLDGDDDTDTTLDEAAVDAFVSDNGYALDSTIAVVGKSGSWTDLLDIPPALLDGDDVLTEADVDAMVADNGFALDADIAAAGKSGSWTDLVDVPADFADDVDDVLTEAEVESFITNGAIDLAAGSTVGGATIAEAGDVVLPVDTTTTCGPSEEGRIRWTGSSFEGCSGTAWLSLAAVKDGSSAGAAGDDCQQILGDYPGTPDGNYWVDTDGPGGRAAYQAFCDMTTDGGGWTRFWWFAPGGSFAGISDVLQQDPGDCPVTSSQCFSTLPVSDPTSLLVEGHNGNWGIWNFVVGNNTSESALAAFTNRVQITHGAGADRAAWNPVQQGGSMSNPYHCNEYNGQPSDNCDSFWYTTQNGMVSFNLDDDTGWGETAWAAGWDNGNVGPGVDHFNPSNVHNSTTQGLWLYYR